MIGFGDPDLARVRGTDLQILEYFKLRHSDSEAKLMNWLRDAARPSDEDLRNSTIHNALVGLSESTVFYTTNYDDFLERAFSLHGRKCHVVASEAEMGVKDAYTEIVKFHGDFDHPAGIVLTESDYERRLQMESPLDYKLRGDLMGRVLLFLGYSFRDPNVSYLFRLFSNHILSRDGSLKGDRAYIVVPDPSSFELELFRARKIEVLKVQSDAMEAGMVGLLNDMMTR